MSFQKEMLTLSTLNILIALAVPRGVTRDAPPGGPSSFIFVQFSAKNRIAPPTLGVGAPPPPTGKSWIRHWIGHHFDFLILHRLIGQLNSHMIKLFAYFTHTQYFICDNVRGSWLTKHDE